jgi:hypothetical protein
LEQHLEKPTPQLVLEAVWEPVCEPEGVVAVSPHAISTPVAAPDSAEQPQPNQEISEKESVSFFAWPDDAGIQIVRATRSWIQYGTVGFAVMCIFIGALEALFGR